jgi:AcrR family transcriptional regulator
MITKQDITEAAYRLFASKGFHETTTEDIARSLGMKKQSLYSHFKSKNEIIGAVLNERAIEIENEITLILDEYRDEPIDILLKFMFTRMTVFMADRDRLLFWRRLLLIESDGEFGDFMYSYNWQVYNKLTLEIKEILTSNGYTSFNDPEKIMYFFISLLIVINGYLDWTLIAKYDNSAVEIIWDYLWNGFKSLFK